MAISLNRRRFLQIGLAATGGANASFRFNDDLLAEERHPMPALPIVDTHQHLWDLSKFRLPWTDGAPTLKKNFLMADYLQAVDGLNVTQTVYMEVDVDPAQQSAEADYVIDLCRRDDNPMAAAVISGRPASERFAAYVRKYRDSKFIKGVRQVLHGPSTPARYCLQDSFVRGIQLLGELGMSFDLCVRPEELADAAELVDRCPDTRFILDHCGNQRPDRTDHSAWQKAIARVADRKNVVCKVSGIIDKAGPGWDADTLAPVVNHTLEVFGPHRVMFGGDWPVCTLGGSFRRWVTALQAIVAERRLSTARGVA